MTERPGQLLTLEVWADERGHWISARFHRASGEPNVKGPYPTLAEAMDRLAVFTKMGARLLTGGGL